MTEQNKMTTSMVKGKKLQKILEAALLAAGQPLSQPQLAELFTDEDRPPNGEISRALEQLKNDCADRGIELVKVASGYRIQVRQEYNQWVSRLWKERPQRYSRALLETMALIAYRQPITRGEIESVRGVSVSTNIIRTLQERDWIRVVGHRDVPGKPALFGTTKVFLDSFNLQNLDDLPTLAEIRDMENLEPELQLEPDVEATDTKYPDEVQVDELSDGGADEHSDKIDDDFGDDLDSDFDDLDDLNDLNDLDDLDHLDDLDDLDDDIDDDLDDGFDNDPDDENDLTRKMEGDTSETQKDKPEQ